MLRVGPSTVRATRGVTAFSRIDPLFPPCDRQQHGISMLRALGCAERRGVSSSEHGSSITVCSQQASTHSANSGCLGVWPTRNRGSTLSAAHFTTPKRLMSTAGGGGGNVQPASNEAATAASGGDVVPDAIAGAAEAAVAAAGTADQAGQAAALAVAPETLGWWPSDLAIMAVDGVHAATGMPYWMTIVAITLGIRTAILPIGLLAARNGARTAAMKPEMDALQEAIKNDQQSSQPRKAERYRQETKALFNKYGASLVMNAALPVVQLPVFIGFFLGLRRMPEMVPDFATGGALWFQDLGAPDPYMAFPIMTGVMMMAMAELGGESGAMAGSSVKMKAGMRGMALLVTPFTMNISTGVFVYWTTSNFYSILQTLSFKSASIKKLFNFPDLPPKKLESSATEKEIGWFDVLGGDNPVKEYRKMQEQREVQAWFGGAGGGPAAAAEGRGNVVREGAPFHAPPPMVGGAVGEKASAPAGQRHAEAPPSKPRVVLSSVRPKPARSSGKGAARRNARGR